MDGQAELYVVCLPLTKASKKNIKISSTPSMHVGMILDVPNSILGQLIRFDDQFSFLENFFSEPGVNYIN